MPSNLPSAPPEPPRNHNYADLCPWFAAQLQQVIATANGMLADEGFALRFDLFEGVRTLERQRWLYGSGRSYRGPWLTNAETNLKSWHGYALAGDVVPRVLLDNGTLGDFTWDVPERVWQILYDAAQQHGCTTGLLWPHRDADHVQPANVKISPSDHAAELLAQGMPAVWAVCNPNAGADA